jgi:predicted transcriptional regulator
LDDQSNLNLSELTADIVSAYVSNNSVRADELASLIGEVHAALQRAPNGAAEPEPEPQEPAVPIRKSVTPDYLICLEDGKKFKSLKRHLQGEHGISPGEYRAKWGLKGDYPMVAPNYSEARSSLAKTMGLGRKAGGSAAVAESAAPAQQAETPAPKRGRKPKVKA